MDERKTLVFSVLVFAFLIVAIFFAGSFNHPYMGEGTRFTAVHESEEGFEQHENWSVVPGDGANSRSNPLHVSELSSSGRTAFRRAQTESPGSFYTETCRSFLVVCDAYDRPSEAPYLQANEQYKHIYVEAEDGDVWLFWARELGHSDRTVYSDAVIHDTVSFVLRTMALLPVALLLGGAITFLRSSQPAAVRTLAGYGGVLGLLAVGYPYVVMVVGHDFYPLLYAILCLTWLVITGWLVNVRRRRAGKPPSGWRALLNNPLVGVQAFLQLCLGAVWFLPIL